MSDFVIGANHPSLFAVHCRRTFIPANKDVLLIEGGQERLWTPLPQGKYCIDQLVANSTGVICLTERRLQVALHFFDATSLQKLGSVQTDIRTETTSMAFSEDGTELYVLSLIPSASVSIFCFPPGSNRCEAAGKVALTHTAAPLSVVSGGRKGSGVDFIVRYQMELHGFAREDGHADYSLQFTVPVRSCAACALLRGTLCFVTADGEVCLFSFRDRSQKSVCVLPSTAAPTALFVANDTAYVATRSGELFTVQLEDGSSELVARLSATLDGCRLLPSEDNHLTVSCVDGLYSIQLTTSDASACRPMFVHGHRAAPTLKCLSVAGGDKAVTVLRNGTCCVLAEKTVTVFPTNAAGAAAIDACLVRPDQVLILYGNAQLRCYNILDGHELWGHGCSGPAPYFVESDGVGNAICCSADAIRFLTCASGSVEDHGVVHATLLASISLARWILNECALLIVCKNGDTFLVDTPSDGAAHTIHAAETLVRNTWRLEFPITDAAVVHATADAVHIFAHSCDHDSKLYLLDRRYEGEAKVSRPLFIASDHASGGGCLALLTKSTLLSCGKDGVMVARDMAPYQSTLQPAAPTRERRSPLWAGTVRSPFLGGITTAAVLRGGASVLCGGRDSVLHCVTAGPASGDAMWDTVSWKSIGTALPQAAEKAAVEAVGGVSSPERAAIEADLGAVREAWTQAMQDKNDDVPLEALMTDGQRAEFATQCDNAVHEMQELQFYRDIMNEYLQDTIKRRCCDSMQVPRIKVVSMSTEDVQVHNFHLHCSTAAEAALSRKALFMRQLQMKAQSGRHCSTTVDQAAYRSTTASEVAQAAPSYVSCMVDETNVYTQSRAVLQTLLVRGHSLSLREDFNARFNDLREHKKQCIAQNRERTRRCITIGKQLGDFPEPLYVEHVDPEEDPDTLFQVDDSELSAVAQALVAPLDVAAVISAIDEAGLRQWMDGLDKEVVQLEVDVAVPDFADEASEAFVPPDERTEEQQRALEAYAKKLKEETEQVEGKKSTLRTEFAALQRQNREAAGMVDEQLESVRQLRMNVAEEVDGAELQLVLLYQQRLSIVAAHRRFRDCLAEVELLQNALVAVQASLAQRRDAYNAARGAADVADGRVTDYAVSSRGAYPFSDGAGGEKLHRRFGRWVRRFVDGKAQLPDPDAPVAEGTLEQWAAFCDHCQEIDRLRGLAKEAATLCERASEEVLQTQMQCTTMEEGIDAANHDTQAVRSGVVAECMNTYAVFRLHQGQVQDEGAATCTDFLAATIQWCANVAQFNSLILASDAESHAVLQKITERRKLIKFLDWEKDRLQYSAGTLQMELRQLHTLRVTREMQEMVNGDRGVTEENRLAGIQRHMELVDTNMGRKLDDLRRIVARLKGQISGRSTENVIVGQQCDNLNDAVGDSAAVQQLIGGNADETDPYAARAKEIYETSELEELARSQQEELVRLKREVDRLRERTFPSFAVVAKQTR